MAASNVSSNNIPNNNNNPLINGNGNSNVANNGNAPLIPNNQALATEEQVQNTANTINNLVEQTNNAAAVTEPIDIGVEENNTAIPSSSTNNSEAVDGAANGATEGGLSFVEIEENIYEIVDTSSRLKITYDANEDARHFLVEDLDTGEDMAYIWGDPHIKLGNDSGDAKNKADDAHFGDDAIFNFAGTLVAFNNVLNEKGEWIIDGVEILDRNGKQALTLGKDFNGQIVENPAVETVDASFYDGFKNQVRQDSNDDNAEYFTITKEDIDGDQEGEQELLIYNEQTGQWQAVRDVTWEEYTEDPDLTKYSKDLPPSSANMVFDEIEKASLERVNISTEVDHDPSNNDNINRLAEAHLSELQFNRLNSLDPDEQSEVNNLISKVESLKSRLANLQGLAEPSEEQKTEISELETSITSSINSLSDLGFTYID